MLYYLENKKRYAATEIMSSGTQTSSAAINHNLAETWVFLDSVWKKSREKWLTQLGLAVAWLHPESAQLWHIVCPGQPITPREPILDHGAPQSGHRPSGPADPGLEHYINNICDKLAQSDAAFIKHLQGKVPSS